MITPFYIEVVGYIATAFTCIAYVPQAIRTIRTRSTKDISLPTYCLLLSGSVIWLFYAFQIQAWPIVVTNVILFTLQGVILIKKLQHG